MADDENILEQERFERRKGAHALLKKFIADMTGEGVQHATPAHVKAVLNGSFIRNFMDMTEDGVGIEAFENAQEGSSQKFVAELMDYVSFPRQHPINDATYQEVMENAIASAQALLDMLDANPPPGGYDGPADDVEMAAADGGRKRRRAKKTKSKTKKAKKTRRYTRRR